MTAAAVYGDECGHAAADEVCPICTPDRRAPSQEARLREVNAQLVEALRASINCFETDPIPLPFAHTRALLAARAALTAAGVQS